MVRWVAIAGVVGSISIASAQEPVARPKFDAFEVATVKPVLPDAKASRYITMQGTDRFVEKDYTLKLLIAAAYSLNPRTISGGPAWIDSDRFDIVAKTPGDVRPTHEEQMAMLRSLLVERFKLTFHRERRVFPIYALSVAKGGAKLKASAAGAGESPVVGPAQVFPQHVVLPAKNATMSDFTTLMQRAILDKPVVDRTRLTGRYDFDLQWAPDETQFDGGLPPATDSSSPPLFTAIQEQLGLKLEATRGTVEALMVDKAERPSAN